MSEAESKETLRKRLLQQRAQLSASEWQRRSLAICAQIFRWISERDIGSIGLYRSFRREVDLRALEAYWPQERFYFPRTLDKEGGMDFFVHPGQDGFHRSRWGLEEPPSDTPPLIPDAKTLILVPGVAFDRQGHRLGYGAGYYDRYLQHFPGIAVGVCLHEFLLEELPNHPHDQPVSSVATDQGFF